jgi:hypothetical protein
MTPTPKELQQTLGVEPHEAEFYANYLEALEIIADELLNPTEKDPDE